ncbi:MAG TPA: YdcF family protein [Candidatus Limnocylindria bacterium]|nr:YdcF family protein [Candidatus Limnocylindria bacterium]
MTQDALGGAPEVIVVLGGGRLPDRSTHPSTARRAEHAAALARERPRAAIVASGGRVGGGGESEAEQIAALLRERGVDRRRILLEDESLDTLGNAVLVALRYLAGATPRPLLLVTSPFHMSRAAWAFSRAAPGWTVEPAPCAVGPDDAARYGTEPEFLADNERTLAGLSDGDLAAFAERLRRQWPEYRSVARLDDT